MIPDQKIDEWYKLTIKYPNLDAVKTDSLKPSVAALIKNANRITAFSWILTSNIAMPGPHNIGNINMPGAHSISVGTLLNEWWHLNSPEGKEGLDTLMSAQLVLAWTAFETLAGDLWEAAINTHHPTLIQKACGGQAIPVRLLIENHGFDLRNKMGTLLIDHLDRPFQSLKSMRERYQSTFPEGWASQRSFWDDKNISAASSIRNLIVHKSSIVDRKFLDECVNDARLLAFKEGEQFYLNGKLLSDLVNGLFVFSGRLIQSVDGWMERNPVSITK
jgi:hypothetical protein